MAAAGQVIVAGIGVVLALIFGVLCAINIGLYGAAGDEDVDLSDNDDCKVPCRERTQVLGVLAGCLGLLLCAAMVVLLLLPVFVSSMAEKSNKIFGAGVLLCFVFVVWVLQLVAWALMAKDIDTFRRDSRTDDCNTPPHLFNAALAFGLFGWLAASAILLLAFAAVGVALMSDGSGSSYGGGGSHYKGNDGGQERGNSHYGDHVAASRAEQQGGHEEQHQY